MFAELASSFSKNFIVVDAKITIEYAVSLAENLKPEYLIVSRVKNGEHYRYVIHTEAFLDAVQTRRPDLTITLEVFLRLHEYHAESYLEVAGDPYIDPETQERISKNLPLHDFVLLDRKGQTIGLFDPQKGKPQAVYLLKGVGHRFQAAERVYRLARARPPLPSHPPPKALKGKAEEKIVFERYPYAKFPTKMALEQIAPLEVIIKATRTEPTARGMVIFARKGEPEVPILVIVKPGSFELIGEYYNTIQVPVEEVVDSRAVVFTLRAKEEGWQTVKVEFFQYGTYVGELEVKTLVVATKLEAGAPQPKATKAQWKLEEVPPEADLTLIVYEKKAEPEFEYEICLRSTKLGILFDKTGPIRFAGNPETKFRAIFQDIERDDLPPKAIEESIRAKGQTLYEQLFPEELKTKYWEIRDKIKSIQIISDEPWVPWEIVKPWRRFDDKIEEDSFLCERYAFSRWLEGKAFRRKERLETAKLVVPKDTNLPKALEEQDWICKFAKRIDLDVSIDSRYDEVFTSLRAGGFDLLHFSTHGRYDHAYPYLSGITLEQGIELRPEHISGLATAFGQAKPLVVLNACQTGAQGFSLTGIGSWATRFLDAGASGFVGTLWSISDETAFRFTQSLYQQLSAGVTLGEAVREARNLSRQAGDPSWLAYEFYGHPNSHVKLGRK